MAKEVPNKFDKSKITGTKESGGSKMASEAVKRAHKATQAKTPLKPPEKAKNY